MKLDFSLKNTENAKYNYLTFHHYFDWLTNLATNVFEWENLPEGVPEYFIEKTLYWRGKALFFKDPELGFFCLPAGGVGKKNVYGEDTEFHAFSYGYERRVLANEGVLIWNNNTKSPTVQIIHAFAGRLSNNERVTDTNLNAQRTPVLLVGDEKSLLTLKNIYKKYEGNEPVIYGDKNFFQGNDGIKAVNTLAPYVIDKLDTHKMNLWNEALTFLGIKNANVEKRERLITSEVEANDQHIKSNVDIMLTSRQRACMQINEMFGTNISVKLRGEENEPIYDGVEVSSGTGVQPGTE